MKVYSLALLFVFLALGQVAQGSMGHGMTQDPDATVTGGHGDMTDGYGSGDGSGSGDGYGDDDDDDDDDDDMMDEYGCCKMKKVGWYVYKLIGASKETRMMYGCDSPCVYKRLPMMEEGEGYMMGGHGSKRSRRVKRDAEMMNNNKWYCFRMNFRDGYPSECLAEYYPPPTTQQTAIPMDDEEDMTTMPPTLPPSL